MSFNAIKGRPSHPYNGFKVWLYTHILELMAVQGFGTILFFHEHFKPRNVKTHCLSQL